jgi:hypothetical protein
VPQDDIRGSSQIARDKVRSGSKLAVAAGKAGLNENGSQAGTPGHFDVPGLVANHP